MCGRFTLYTPLDEIVERFSLGAPSWDYVPSYNVAPTQMVFAVIPEQEGRAPSPFLLRWGLTPAWQKKGAGRPLINARLETLAEKPTFRGLVNTNRCLIIADGFYEWKTENGEKHPVYITLDGGKPFAFAGLWEDCSSPSCTIVTQAASSFMEPIHHRMPVILTPETEPLWLSSLPFAELAPLLPDQEGRSFRYHRVSKLVNSPRNNQIECIMPLE